jgi:hypothetical protein
MSIENARSTQVKTAKSTATSTICERWDWDRGYDSAEEEADAYRKEEEEALRLIRLDPAFAGRMDEIEAAFRAPPDFGKMVAEMEAAFRMAGAKPSQDSLFEITAMTKVNGPLTKRLFLKDDGKLGKDSTGCKMWVGRARRLRLSTLAELTAHINGMKSNEALALGRLEASLPDDVGIATKARLNRSAASVTVARAKGYLSYLPDVPAPILIDIDDKGMPDEVRRAIEAIGGVWEALRRVLPELATTARIMRRSTSSCIRHAVTGEQFPGSDGLHIYILVKDGTDAKRFLYDLHNRCWHAGFGWHVVSKSGSLLERSLIDRMVYGAERLVFEAPPKVEAPLEQDRAARAAVAHDGSILDTHEACPPLSPTETAALKQALSASAAAMAPECAAVRAQYIADRGEELAERASMPLADARRVIEKQIEGVL